MEAAATELVRELAQTIRDERVLAALANVPRQRFVPAGQQPHAYANQALPIDCGQTISQPLVVARMLELLALEPQDRVLDVGTGSGYHAALLSRLAAEVVSIERHPQLARQAAQTLAKLDIDNVEVLVGDGAAGVPDRAPFDAINVAAASVRIPRVLEAQLGDGGRLIAPVGGRRQRLVLSRRVGDAWRRSELEPVRFVPLVGGAHEPD